MGLRHPLPHLRGKAINILRTDGLQVDVLGEDLKSKHFEVISKSNNCLAIYQEFCVLFS